MKPKCSLSFLKNLLNSISMKKNIEVFTVFLYFSLILHPSEIYPKVH